jgi:hypothetical protein
MHRLIELLIDKAGAWSGGFRIGIGHDRAAGRPASPRPFGSWVGRGPLPTVSTSSTIERHPSVYTSATITAALLRAADEDLVLSDLTWPNAAVVLHVHGAEERRRLAGATHSLTTNDIGLKPAAYAASSTFSSSAHVKVRPLRTNSTE